MTATNAEHMKLHSNLGFQDDGGPAFPAWELNGNGQPEMTCFGMTLRDYFAAKAMAGALAESPSIPSETLAKHCYELADHMLKAREVKS